LARLAPDQVLALVHVYASPPKSDTVDRRSYVPERAELYLLKGRHWAKFDPPLPPEFRPRSLCSTDNGVLLLLAAGARVVTVTYDGQHLGPLKTLPAPQGAPYGWETARLLCRGNDAWLAGEVLVDPSKALSLIGGRRPVLFRLSGLSDGGWSEFVDLPPADGTNADGTLSSPSLEAMAFDPAGRLWLGYFALTPRSTGPLYRLDGDTWHRFDLPPVPEVRYYQVFDLAFDDKGEGWAVANRWANAIKPESHGILLHFANGVWQQRGWAWSPLRQRWFGLLGGLR